MALDQSHHLDEEEESYFVSMTDLMVGMLFVFIIMLMAFALNFQVAEESAEQAKVENQELERRIEQTQRARTLILRDIKRLLEEQGVDVQIDEETGILRLPENILFDKAKSELNQQGEDSLGVLADAMMKVLPCYAPGKGQAVAVNCPPQNGARLEAVFIEGHTDNDPVLPGAAIRDNLQLSALRALATYRTLLSFHLGLGELRNGQSEPLLSVSSYGENRPINKIQITEEQKRQNRRIDLRFLMATPSVRNVDRLKEELQRQQ